MATRDEKMSGEECIDEDSTGKAEELNYKKKQRDKDDEGPSHDDNDGVSGFINSIVKQVRLTTHDDDITDRLNHHYTPLVLVILNFVIFLLFREKILCWAPAHFSDYQEQYANEYCWVKNTYYLPFDDNIPREYEKRDHIYYYQWVPFLLLMQALLFYAPCYMWRTLSIRSGLHVADFIDKTACLKAPPNPIEMELLRQMSPGKVHKDMRKKALMELTTMFRRFVKGLEAREKMKCTLSFRYMIDRLCSCCSSREGRYLFTTYMLVKFWYLFNIAIQLLVMNYLLGKEHQFFGLDVVQRFLNDEDWTESGAFPRVTMCDFKVRRLGNVQRYTLQCALPINLWNEKIYLFLYFWMLILAVLTTLSIIYWLYKAGTARARVRYTRNHLLIPGVTKHHDPNKLHAQQEALAGFTDTLHADGIFLLMLVAVNVDNLSEADLVLEVWRRYCLKEYTPLKNRPELQMICKL